jgi:hypothetical protein
VNYTADEVKLAITNYRDAGGYVVGVPKKRMQFKTPELCEKYAALVQMQPVNFGD